MPPNTERGRSTLGRRDGLETREREERERQRERELLIGRVHAELGAVRQRAGREDEHEAEHDQQHLRHEIERRHDDADPVERRPPQQPHAGDGKDHEDPHDHVPRLAVERVDVQRPRQVVRQEQRRQRHHDQVVEEQRPAGEEPGEVVPGAADECRSAAGLGQRRRPLGVRKRDDEEDDARE